MIVTSLLGQESVLISTILSIVIIESHISDQKASIGISWDGLSSEKKLYTWLYTINTPGFFIIQYWIAI